MFGKALTNFIILALVVLPVQVLSAGIENSNMQMKTQLKMSQLKGKADSKCMHKESANSTKQSAKKDCCKEHSNQCKSCNNCPQVAAMALTTPYKATQPFLTQQQHSTHYLFLNGAPQKNLLRPPRTLI